MNKDSNEDLNAKKIKIWISNSFFGVNEIHNVLNAHKTANKNERNIHILLPKRVRFKLKCTATFGPFGCLTLRLHIQTSVQKLSPRLQTPHF